MGTGRRKFTKEFRDQEVRRLGLRVHWPGVARACELNRNGYFQ